MRATRLVTSTLKAVAVAVLLAALAVLGPGTAVADDDDDDGPSVFPPGSHPYGESYGEWSARWWQWAFSIPDAIHPLNDPTGERAGIGQRGEVFFLGGSFNNSNVINRTITVPRGKALFFPIVNSENDNFCPPNDPPLTIAELRAQIRERENTASALACEIDGHSVAHLERYRAASPVFNVHLPEGNICDVDAGTYTGLVADGYYVMVRPLSRGQHTIHFHGSLGSPPNFTLDVTYHITVR